MKLKNISTFYKVIFCISLLCVILIFFIPVTGRMVLFSECCYVIMTFVIGIASLNLVISTRKTESFKKLIPIWILVLVFLGVGVMQTKDILLDVFNGSKTIILTNYTIEKRTRMRGIIIPHYYISGTDSNGKKYRFKISKSDCERILHSSTVYIKGYENTGRVIELN